MSQQARTPNPGSQEARDQGCLCPRMDNCNGKWAPRPPDGWFIRSDCPLHATLKSEED